ncbi:protein ADM2 isoform X2 [Protopterus annectens]|uniref:protein ADM2 isoform X2 n=1 Tax=Protopterus annectens TaxID=7888 RepID=UPI001CFC3EF6|nr:protein ADM2 isoform X2 [Protopterus annectens]
MLLPSCRAGNDNHPAAGLTEARVSPPKQVHDKETLVVSASDEEHQKKSQQHASSSALPKFAWIRETRKRKRKGFHNFQSLHNGSFVPQEQAHRHYGSLQSNLLSTRERLKNSRNRRHTHGSSRAHLMRVGCVLGTCQVQNLSHRLWQLMGQSGREDSAPVNPNSPLSFG